MKSRNTKSIAAIAGTMLTLALIGANTIQVVSAATTADTLTRQIPKHEFNMKEKRPELKNVSRSVQNISNGVQVTLTSTDADTVTKLQQHQMPQPPKDAPADAKKPDISFTQTNVTNGVQITITSTDATVVSRIQEDAKNNRGPGFGPGPRHPMMKNRMMPGKENHPELKNVSRSVQNISNGVQVTLTSTDADTVTKLQQHQMPQPPKDAPADAKKPDISFTQTNVTNGVQITITSTDATVVSRIQEDAKNNRGPGFGPGPRHDRQPEHMEMNETDQNNQ